MKKLFIITFLLTVFLSCKNNTKSEQEQMAIDADSGDKTTNESDGFILLKGDFIYYADAAILQTDTEIYGIVIDEKMYELNNQVQAHKNEATDMVPVEISGKIIPKPENEEGWPFRIEIKEILNISKPNPEENNVVKLGKE